MMQLLYRRPDGSLRVGELAEQQLTGSSLKSYIASEEGVTEEAIHLQCQGRPVADDVEILFGSSDCLEVETTYALCGGAKGKKKKKQYTTPKHVPHKRKKVKLAVLKYYSIDGDDVVRTRMFCATKTCGRGVMMAAHHDRCHCGKCGLTLLKKNN